MLIGVRNKLTRLNGAITPEAIYKLKDKIGGIFTEQEKNEEMEIQTSIDMAMTATTVTGHANKVAAHWAQKLANRRSCKLGVLDTGATSGAAPKEDEDAFKDTGELSRKTCMFPDKQTNKATKKMLLKHKLHLAAREMNIVPGLHSTLVSVPRLADAGYTRIFSKTGVAIYNDNTTIVTANKPPRPGRQPVQSHWPMETTSARG